MYRDMIGRQERQGRLISARGYEIQQDRPLRIAVCGKFKSGKTSLLNLLFGLDLPVQAVTATTLVTRIEKGVGSYLESGDGTRVEITPNERNKLILGTKKPDGNPAVSIIVKCDSPLLGSEGTVEFWDTPGLEDAPGLTEITMQALDLCDLAILVFDANKFGSWYEKITLENLQELLGGNVVYVINRVDLLNTAEDLANVKRSAEYLLEDYGNTLLGHGTILYTSASPNNPDISALYRFVSTLADDSQMRRSLRRTAAGHQLKCMLGKWTSSLTEDMDILMQELAAMGVDWERKHCLLESMKRLLDYFDYAMHMADIVPGCDIGDRWQMVEQWKTQLRRYEPPGVPAVRPLSGRHGNTEVLLDGRQLCFGRDAAYCQVLYRDGTPGVSKFHCMLTWDEDRKAFILVDMHSSYGTFLQDGTRLMPGKQYMLRPGACFFLGDVNNEVRTGYVKKRGDAYG